MIYTYDKVGVTMRTGKPKLSIEQQILKLKEKGIKFHFYTEEDSIAYLKANNNFFKLTSYRKNFTKVQNGVNKGKYENLDFGYLVDLAIIDTRLRILVLEMALNIEHFAKVNLLSYVSDDSSEDGYSIVSDYIESLTVLQRERLMKEMENRKTSEYCGDLILKYKGQYPIWAFVEILSFGDFLYFYKYCAKKYTANKNLKTNFHLMFSVKAIRNAAAHNNCIMNNLLSRSSDMKDVNHSLLRDLATNTRISKQIRDTHLSKLRIHQIITLLYAHKTIVTSTGMHKHIAERLQDLSARFFKNHDYTACESLKTSLKFIKEVVDFWFKIA